MSKIIKRPKRQPQFRSYEALITRNASGGTYGLSVRQRSAVNAFQSLRPLLSQSRPQEAVTDALADLRHFCDAAGLDFAELDHSAHNHYSHELFENE